MCSVKWLLVTFLTVARFFGVATPGSAGDDSPQGGQQSGLQEKPLVGGPIKIEKGYRRIMKPFRPWRVNWESYLYRDWYPSNAESIWYWRERAASPDGKPGWMPDELAESYTHRATPFVQAEKVFSHRFFHVPPEESRRGHNFRCAAMAGRYLDTHDWQGYERLRIDATFPEDVHVWWAIEDRFLQPPVVGNFDVPGGEWVTLELDLEKAAKERGLELNRMWRMWMSVDSARKCQLKDIRLAQADTPSEYPIRQDPNAAALPTPPPVMFSTLLPRCVGQEWAYLYCTTTFSLSPVVFAGSRISSRSASNSRLLAPFTVTALIRLLPGVRSRRIRDFIGFAVGGVMTASTEPDSILDLICMLILPCSVYIPLSLISFPSSSHLRGVT